MEQQNLQSYNFWDFKSKITYAKTSQKIIDFLLGFFVIPLVIIIVFLFSPLIIPYKIWFDYYLLIYSSLAIILLVIEVGIYFNIFKKRKFVSTGILFSWVIILILIIYFILSNLL